MGIGLYIFWIIIGGLPMWWLREPIGNFVHRIPGGWTIKFIVFATALAMLEEVVTVAMANTASLYGVAMAQATRYRFGQLLGRGVVLFVPMFCIWAWLLARYAFSAESVFLIWGVTGTLLEILYAGPSQVLQIGMWIFVYGLRSICLPLRFLVIAERNRLGPGNTLLRLSDASGCRARRDPG